MQWTQVQVAGGSHGKSLSRLVNSCTEAGCCWCQAQVAVLVMLHVMSCCTCATETFLLLGGHQVLHLEAAGHQLPVTCGRDMLHNSLHRCDATH